MNTRKQSIYSVDELPSFGLVIGANAPMPYAHLHLESWRKNYPDIPVVMYDNAVSNPLSSELRALCEEYGADFVANVEAQTAQPRELSALIAGFEWAQKKHIDVLVKMSRRFIPLIDWRPELTRLALRTQYATFTNHSANGKIGFRAECIAMHVPSWHAAGVTSIMEKQLAAGHPPSMDAFLHSLARRVHLDSCIENREHEILHPKTPEFDAYGDWRLPGTERDAPMCHALWHQSCDWVEYCRAALQYGIKLYSPAEWSRGNYHRPPALRNQAPAETRQHADGDS